MEYGVSKGNVINEDIIVGSLFYFLRDVSDFYKFILDIKKACPSLLVPPVVGC